MQTITLELPEPLHRFARQVDEATNKPLETVLQDSIAHLSLWVTIHLRLSAGTEHPAPTSLQARAAIPVMGFVVTTLVVWAAQPATKVATTMPYHVATMLKRELLRHEQCQNDVEDHQDNRLSSHAFSSSTLRGQVCVRSLSE